MSHQTKQKYEIIAVNDIEVMADVSLLSKNDDLFFNATLIARQFDKKTNDFLKLESTKEYIDIILKDSQVGISRLENLVRTQHGGAYKGTWLHKELAFEFFGWCSAVFRRAMHNWVNKRIEDEHRRQQHRLTLKTGFAPLTNAIKTAHPKAEAYYYSNECDLINRLVTGMTAKQFKQVQGIKNVRDGLTAAQAQLMDTLQRQNTGLIELGFSYDKRKSLLKKYANEFYGTTKAVA